MRWQSFVAYELPAFKWIGACKRASVLVITLFVAALLSAVAINVQQLAPKFDSFGSDHEQLNTSLGIAVGVDSVWAAATNNNRIHKSRVAENNDDHWNSLSVGWGQTGLFRIEYFQLPAFVFVQVVDQICSYRFILH